MEGIAKVIDELGAIILAKDIELETKRNEIDELKEKIHRIEQYLDLYEEIYTSKNEYQQCAK